MAGQVGRVDVDDRSTIGEMGVVMHDQHPVAGTAHIELDSVAAQRPGQAKCLDGVLPGGPGGAPMGQYLYHRYPPSVGTMSENLPIPLVNGGFVS